MIELVIFIGSVLAALIGVIYKADRKRLNDMTTQQSLILARLVRIETELAQN